MKRRRVFRFHVSASAFRAARANAALTREQAASYLGVTPRTIRNWEGKRFRVPYSALKLLRVLTGYALPDEAWHGWVVRGDTLWSPEQKGFRPHDFNWWGLTVAMARAWRAQYRSAPRSKVIARIALTAGDVDALDAISAAGHSAQVPFDLAAPVDSGQPPQGAEAQRGGVTGRTVTRASLRPSKKAVIHLPAKPPIKRKAGRRAAPPAL